MVSLEKGQFNWEQISAKLPTGPCLSNNTCSALTCATRAIILLCYFGKGIQSYLPAISWRWHEQWSY